VQARQWPSRRRRGRGRKCVLRRDGRVYADGAARTATRRGRTESGRRQLNDLGTPTGAGHLEGPDPAGDPAVRRSAGWVLMTRARASAPVKTVLGNENGADGETGSGLLQARETAPWVCPYSSPGGSTTRRSAVTAPMTGVHASDERSVRSPKIDEAPSSPRLNCRRPALYGAARRAKGSAEIVPSCTGPKERDDRSPTCRGGRAPEFPNCEIREMGSSQGLSQKTTVVFRMPSERVVRAEKRAPPHWGALPPPMVDHRRPGDEW
jgi:hypothetical protein